MNTCTITMDNNDYNGFYKEDAPIMINAPN